MRPSATTLRALLTNCSDHPLHWLPLLMHYCNMARKLQPGQGTSLLLILILIIVIIVTPRPSCQDRRPELELEVLAAQQQVRYRSCPNTQHPQVVATLQLLVHRRGVWLGLLRLREAVMRTVCGASCSCNTAPSGAP